MLFNSFEFMFVFLPITFVVYFLLNKAKLLMPATGWLVAASLFFYSYWKLDYLPLILISMIFNYVVGAVLSRNDNLKVDKKAVLAFGLVANVALLVYYKYFDFLIYSFNKIFSAEFNYMHIVLPLAISFFTFQQIAYLVDSYKGKTKEYDFLTYALFITFFPQLIAGPIVHHGDVMPQFLNLRNRFINPKNVAKGLFLFSIGLFKKVVVADYFAPFVATVFDGLQSVSFLEIWTGVVSYTFQLYFDFSGYADMALGLGLLFNISLPSNFNSPLKSADISEFWRRWHITLSNFLKNYVYIPLGGSRVGTFNTYRNLFITFLVSGIWHGANMTFILWGAMHGIAVCLRKFWHDSGHALQKIPAVALTFLFLNFGFIFFRSASVSRALYLTKSAFGLNGFGSVAFDKMRLAFEGGSLKLSLFLLIPAIYAVFFMKNSLELTENFKPNKVYLFVTLLLLTFSVLNFNRISEFLYFQF